METATKRVLVVDDEPIVRESYTMALADAGYSVQAVACGRDAIQACRNEHFDVMLTDIRMPDMDGIEVARVITREFPDLRVVLITGYPSRETEEQASRIGVASYLQKPLAPDRLSDATAEVIRQPGMRFVINTPTPAVEPTSDPEAEPNAEEMPPMSSIPVALSTSQKDISATTAALVIASTPLIGFLYFVLFPFVAAGVALGVVFTEIVRAIRGK